MKTTETFDSSAYAEDAVRTLALALNETLQDQVGQMAMGAQVIVADQNLSAALQATTFTGATVSQLYTYYSIVWRHKKRVYAYV